MSAATSPPTTPPAPLMAAVAPPDRPAIPADCKRATRPPAATPPPLATAAVDIMLAAMEPPAIPTEVKPMAPRTRGAATTVVPAPNVAAAAIVKRPIVVLWSLRV